MEPTQFPESRQGLSPTALAAVIVIVLAIIGAGIVYMVHHRHHTTTNTAQSAQQVPINQLLSQLTAKPPYPHLITSQNNVGATGTVPYSVPGKSFFVAAKDTATLAWVGDGSLDPGGLDAGIKGMKGKLLDDGYTFNAKPPINLAADTSVGAFYYLNDTGYYTRGSSICLLGAADPLAATDITDAYPGYLIVDCTTTDALAQLANQVAPLAAAYANAPAGQAPFAHPFFRAPVTIAANQKSPHYQYASVGIGDTQAYYESGPEQAYFYTDQSGSNWHFAQANVNPPACNGLNGDAAKALSTVCQAGS